MPDGGLRCDVRTLRTHLLDAEFEIIEINRQIAERQRFGIPTIGLEQALTEVIAERDVLKTQLEKIEAD